MNPTKTYKSRRNSSQEAAEAKRLMDTFTPMWMYGAQVGCKQDQLTNFTKAGIFLQPKQLDFCARARECDEEGGPTAVMSGGGRGPLWVETPILTMAGWKTMGTLQVGDVVFDENGKPCNVTAKSEVFHNRECYEFEFDTGEKIISDSVHEWMTTSKLEQKAIDRRNPVFRARRRIERGGKHAPHLIDKNVLPVPPNGSIKSTKQIVDTVRYQKGREANHRIRVTKPLVIPEKELPLHPYLFGLWLGDGDSARGYFTTADDLHMAFEAHGFTAKFMGKYRYAVNGIYPSLKSVGVIKNKHIPEEYFHTHQRQRIHLVQGLMDTDGSCCQGGRSTFCNTNRALAFGFARLLRSLGVKCSISDGLAILNGRVISEVWKVHFTSWFNPFNLERKAKKYKLATRKTQLNHYIISAKKVNSVPVQCIAVDSPSHLFLCGESLIPTHNSAKSHAILSQIFADDCQRFPNLKVLLLRKIGKANAEQVQDYRTKLLSQIPHEYKQQAQELIFPNGSKVLMGNFKDEKDIDRYMGQEYDLIYLMESNQLTFQKKKFILTCLRTSKPGWRPRLYEDTNPGGIGMAENKAMYVIPWKQGREKETGTRYVHSTVYDNKFINKEYVTQLESLTGWQRRAWLDGDWDFAAGSFFTNFIPEIHVYPNPKVQFEGKSKRWWMSYDHGFAHNTACILFCEDKGITYVVDEWVDSECVIPEQAENILEMLKQHHVSIHDLEFAVAGKDCFSRNPDGKTIADIFTENGIDFTVAEVDRANGWKRCHSLFGDLEVGIQPKIYIHSRCKHLISQIQLAQHSLKRAGDVEKFNADSEGNGGDDALDAWRFGIASDPNHAITFARPVSMSKSPYQLIGMGG